MNADDFAYIALALASFALLRGVLACIDAKPSEKGR